MRRRYGGTSVGLPNGRSTRAESRAGFTILEVMIAITVLVGALLGFSQAILTSASSARNSHQVMIATEAARDMLEGLLTQADGSYEFEELFAAFNSEPGDDPDGAGTAPGADFAVTGLDAVAGDVDGFPGKIIFPTMGGAPGVLREDFVDPAWAMPRDLTGSGGWDGADHSLDYGLLPVLIRIEWRGGSSSDRVELRTLLGGI